MRLIAHRGFAAVHPENTLRAVRESARVADLVEVDVRRCGSGELVVVHDPTVDRVTDGSGRVRDLTLSELRDLDVLASGQPVPTLAEVLDAVSPPVGVNVELKERETAESAAEMLADADVDVLVSSFNADALAVVGETAPNLPTALLFEFDPRENLRRAAELDCAAVHPHHEQCSEGLVRRAHAAGLSVHAWTVADAATAGALGEAGVDGVIADLPGVLAGRAR